MDYKMLLCRTESEVLDFLMSERVIGFNVIYQQFRAMYNSGCQTCCYWSRLKPGFNVLTHRSTMPQINMIPHPSHFKLTLGQPALLGL